jgi:hypothetical protein
VLLCFCDALLGQLGQFQAQGVNPLEAFQLHSGTQLQGLLQLAGTNLLQLLFTGLVHRSTQ